MIETRKFVDFRWPLAEGVLEEWVTITTEEKKGKKKVLSRQVEYAERKPTWRERFKAEINARLA